MWSHFVFFINDLQLSLMFSLFPFCSTPFGFVVLRSKFSIVLPVCYLFCFHSSARVSTKLGSRVVKFSSVILLEEFLHLGWC